MVTAIYDMINRTGILESQLAGHTGIVAVVVPLTFAVAAQILEGHLKILGLRAFDRQGITGGRVDKGYLRGVQRAAPQ